VISPTALHTTNRGFFVIINLLSFGQFLPFDKSFSGSVQFKNISHKERQGAKAERFNFAS